MAYETPNERSRKPFVPDLRRGHWAAPNDFLYACWGAALKMDIFHILWFFPMNMGIYPLIPYIISMVLFVVPIIAIQSFLGRFSSSGFISVFRIAPLFKSMGYISLVVNFMMLSHMSAFAAIPLFYLFHSVRPTLPWSCESFLEWSKDLPTNGEFNTCNKEYYGTYAATYTTTTTSPYSEELPTETYGYDNSTVHIPSAVFFRSLFKNYDLTHEINFSLSWELLLCMLVVWTVIAFIFYKIVTAEQMGKFIRSTIWLLMSLLLICALRMCFLPYVGEALEEYFMPSRFSFDVALSCIPIFALAALGTGWGNVVSLASYNKFKTNIMQMSWFVCLGQIALLILFELGHYVIDTHYSIITGHRFYTPVEYQWLLHLATGSVFADFMFSNLWCIIFFSLLLLSGLLILVIHLFTLLTAIFDEFQFLRAHRQKVTLTLIGLLFVCSIHFCTNHGLANFAVLPIGALITQSALNLLLLLIVLCIYGHVRFQRDMEFMLSQRFDNWRMKVLCYLAPLALLAALVLCLFVQRYFYSSLTLTIATIFFIIMPWLFVPGFGILGIFQTTGCLSARLKSCCRPRDWYPVDPAERQRYEDAVSNMDITHQLNVINVEER